MPKCLLSLLFIFLVSNALAQTRKSASTNGISRKKTYDRTEYIPFLIGVHGGLTQFFGELNDQDMQGVFGMTVGRSINKHVILQLNLSSGKLGGEKIPFFNSWFENEFNAVDVIAKWDLTEQISHQEPGNAHFSIYGGLGLIHFSANAFDIDNNELIRFTNSQQSARNPLFLRWGKPKSLAKIKKTREGMLPLGTSVDYRLLKHWEIGLDYRFYFVRTDKLDATSGQRLINPEESESYSDTPNDKFSFIAVTLAYRFR